MLPARAMLSQGGLWLQIPWCDQPCAAPTKRVIGTWEMMQVVFTHMKQVPKSRLTKKEASQTVTAAPEKLKE